MAEPQQTFRQGSDVKTLILFSVSDNPTSLVAQPLEDWKGRSFA